ITGSGGNAVGGPPSFLPSGGPIAALSSSANTISGNLNDGVLINNLGAASSIAANSITGNLISRNSHNGIHVIADLGGTAEIAQITANFIGTDATGLTTYDQNNRTLGNGLSGMLLESSGSALGSIIAAMVSANVSSGNGLSGITV